jgi:hypothetical protein
VLCQNPARKQVRSAPINFGRMFPNVWYRILQMIEHEMICMKNTKQTPTQKQQAYNETDTSSPKSNNKQQKYGFLWNMSIDLQRIIENTTLEGKFKGINY